MNTLPKAKCPPAKPPRRKLSYSSESGKGTTTDSSVLNGSTEGTKLLTFGSKGSVVNTHITQSLPSNVADMMRNQNLSKSSSSASSASKESGGSPTTDIGSDYGSFQGDHSHLPSSERYGDHLIERWPTPSKALFRTPKKSQFSNYSTESPTSHRFCCSTNSPLKPSFGKMSHSTPTNQNNNSIYYTPQCTTPTCFRNCSEKEKSSNLRNSSGNDICLGQTVPTCCGVERRHNSDPQISLERRPSRRLKGSLTGKMSLSNRNKRLFAEEPVKRTKRSQSFACNQHLHHHHHHHETESPRVLLLPHSTVCCLDSWMQKKPEKTETIEDICHKIWKKHQSQSNGEWNNSKTSKNSNFSEILSEIYYSQKERDKAIQERLEIVTEQRNKLIEEVESLQQIIFRQNVWKNDSQEDESDFDSQNLESLDQLLLGLNTSSPSKLEIHKEQILAQVNKAHKRRSKVSSSRRNSSQPQSLMEELNNPAEQWDCDGFVCQKVSEERSKTIQKMSEMEDGLTSLQLYSLRNNGFLNGHDKNADNFQKSNSDDEDDEEIGVFHLESEHNPNDDELRAKLQKESKARHEAEDNCRKLERLVNVLRKKLAGTSLGVQV